MLLSFLCPSGDKCPTDEASLLAVYVFTGSLLHQKYPNHNIFVYLPYKWVQ